MNVDKFIVKSKDQYKTIVEKVRIGDKSAEGDIIALTTQAFNEGIFSQIQATSKKAKSTGEMNSYLPDYFENSDIANQLIEMTVKAITANSINGYLNAGFQLPVGAAVRQVIKTIYMVGLNAGFEISSDPKMREIYLADKERFVGTTQ